MLPLRHAHGSCPRSPSLGWSAPRTGRSRGPPARLSATPPRHAAAAPRGRRVTSVRLVSRVPQAPPRICAFSTSSSATHSCNPATAARRIARVPFPHQLPEQLARRVRETPECSLAQRASTPPPPLSAAPHGGESTAASLASPSRRSESRSDCASNMPL